MKWLLKVNTWFLLINFTLELMTVNTNLDMVTDLTENTTEKITKIKIGSYLVILHSLLHTASSNKVKLHLGRCLVGVEFYKRRD